MKLLKDIIDSLRGGARPPGPDNNNDDNNDDNDNNDDDRPDYNNMPDLELKKKHQKEYQQMH